MTESRTVLEHLLDGRDALVEDVKRLTVAIDELDSVIARIGGDALRQPATYGDRSAAAAAAATTPVDASGLRNSRSPAVQAAQPVSTNGRRSSAPRKVSAKAARTAPTRKAAAVKAPVQAGEAPRSIRLHVLDMLGAEDRPFGLAEIIDRIHDQGIQAHDDAVRSITIKLMKDGKVERVERGQYRLARRGSDASTTVPTPDETIAPTQTTPVEAPATTPAQAPARAQSAATGYPSPPNLGVPWSPRT